MLIVDKQTGRIEDSQTKIDPNRQIGIPCGTFGGTCTNPQPLELPTGLQTTTQSCGGCAEVFQLAERTGNRLGKSPNYRTAIIEDQEGKPLMAVKSGVSFINSVDILPKKNPKHQEFLLALAREGISPIDTVISKGNGNAAGFIQG